MVLTQTERPSSRLLTVAFAFVLVGLIGLAIRSTNTESAPATTGSAEVEIAGMTYEFMASACTVTATDFLVGGTGEVDGQDFWISISPESAEVALGTADERTRSDDADDLWLMGDVTWQANGEAVEGALVMRNERIADAPPVRGRFTATCSSA